MDFLEKPAILIEKHHHKHRI